jgi:hypothetical protein
VDGEKFKKLQPRWCGPFKVTRVIPHNAVELNSKELGHDFHNVVNVDRLKPYVSSEDIDDLNEALQRQFAGIDLETAESDEHGLGRVDQNEAKGDVADDPPEENSSLFPAEETQNTTQDFDDDIRIVFDDEPYEAE